MEVRPFKDLDLEPVAKLYIDVFSSEPWNEVWKFEWVIDRLITISNSPGFCGFVGEDQDKAIVAATMGRSISFKGDKEFEILEFFVAKEFQGKGFGKKLYDYLEQDLVSRHYSNITLLTERGIPAEEFYLSKGFSNSKRMTFMTKKLD